MLHMQQQELLLMETKRIEKKLQQENTLRFFSEMFQLRLHGMGNGLVCFIFTCIDPKQVDREYSLVLDMKQEKGIGDMT